MSDDANALALLNRYLSCHKIFDAQVALNDVNSKGHVWVLCGDDQGGRDFYLAKKDLQRLEEYCKKHGCEYEAFYLPDDCVNGCGYAPGVEHELYEIWREQIEYGDTDYDYSTWRKVYGDEYARANILPYMQNV